MIVLPYNYYPRSYHMRFLEAHRRGFQHLMGVIHRRAGKSSLALNILVRAMMQRVGNYGYFFPYQTEARIKLWNALNHNGEYMIDAYFPPHFVYSKNNTTMTITTVHPSDVSSPGSTLSLLGTDKNVNVAVGGNFIGYVWDEFALQNPMARRLARKIMAENGGWEFVPFTPRGENHGYELYEAALSSPHWYVELLTVEDTLRDSHVEDGRSSVIAQKEIELEREEGELEEVIQQEYYCSWKSPMPGAYYADQMRYLEEQGRITTVDWMSDKPVFVFGDLGTSKGSDTNCFWFVQVEGNRIYHIDCEIHNAKGMEFFASLFKSKPYAYAGFYLKSSDIETVDFGMGLTRYQIALQFGIEFQSVPTLSIAEGINATRQILRRSVFDNSKPMTKLGVSGLRSYRQEYNEETRTFVPVRDWACHIADAERYLAVGIDKAVENYNLSKEPIRKPVIYERRLGEW